MEKNDEISATKKEPNYRGVKAMPFIIGNEAFEKLGTTGSSSNLLVYLTTVFNMKSITATNFVNIFNGTCNFATLIGAFLSDNYFGRYKAIGFSSVSSFLGMLVLALTAAFSKLHPKSCESLNEQGECEAASPGQLTFLFSGFVLLVIGAGGIRSCNYAFGADQFNPNTDSGKRGLNSFFNWFYFTYTFGMTVSLTVIVYVQSNLSWTIGLGIPAFLMLLSCIFFFIGTKVYVKVLPEGSPLTGLVQTLVVAFKKRKLKLTEQPWKTLFNRTPEDSINSKLEYTEQLRFLNKASIPTQDDKINSDGSNHDPWKLRSLQQVEELKCVVKLIPIWISAITYYMILVLHQNYSVFQALQSDRSLGRSSFKIPAATYNVFTFLSLTIWIPIHDRIVLPSLKRITGNVQGITVLQRVGIGMFFGILSMVLAGAVEMYRRSSAFTRPALRMVVWEGVVSSMSGNWLILQLSLGGLSEGFAVVGLIELFYNQFPENMRSLGPSFLTFGFAISSYLSSFLIWIVNETSKGSWLCEDLNQGRLDYFYHLVAGLEAVNLVYFLVCANWYKYKKVYESDKMEDVKNGCA